MTTRTHDAMMRLLWTLLAMASLAVILDTWESTKERNQRKVAAAERQVVIDTPVQAWFAYFSVNQAHASAPSSGPLTMLSKAEIRRPPLTVNHVDILRCKPKAGGPYRFISSKAVSVPYSMPTTIGMGDGGLQGVEGVRTRDGEWDYGGRLPQYDATCLMTASPCIEPFPGVRKCHKPLESGPIVIVHEGS